MSYFEYDVVVIEEKQTGIKDSNDPAHQAGIRSIIPVISIMIMSDKAAVNGESEKEVSI